MTLRGGKRGQKVLRILTLLIIFSISLAVLATLLPAVSADYDGDEDGIPDYNETYIIGSDPDLWTNTDGTVYTEASPNSESVDIEDTVRIKLEVYALNTTEKVPVDLMHVIDTSESMAWYGDVIHKNSGSLPSEWAEIDTFTVDNSSVSKFDVLLETNSEDINQYLKIMSPSGEWYGHGNTSEFHYPPNYINNVYHKSDGADYIGIYASDSVENGTWTVYAKGAAGRPYVLAVQVPTTRLDAAKNASKTVVGLMSPPDNIGVVSFSSTANLDYQLTTATDAKKVSINLAIDDLDAYGGSAIGEGIKQAKGELISARGRPEAVKIMVLLADGVNTAGCDPIAEAEKAAAKRIKIFTIGFGEADHELLREIASITKGQYFYAENGSDLEGIYKTILGAITGFSSRNYAFYVLPDGIEYAGNATEEPAIIIGNTLLWGIDDLVPNTSWSVSFDVQFSNLTRMGENIPLSVGRYSGVSYELLGVTVQTTKTTAGANCKIVDSDSDVSFGFVVQRKAGQAWPEGEFEFHDHITGMNLHSEDMEILAATENITIFRGTAEVNGVPGYEFIANAEKSESGDIFEILITGPGGFSYRLKGMVQGTIHIYPGSTGYVPFPEVLVNVKGLRLVALNISALDGRFISESVPVTGYAVVNNTGRDANVSVKICVEGYPISGTIHPVPTANETPPENFTVNVSYTWYPMDSGNHSISIELYELRDDGITEFWMPAQGLPNTKTTNKKIYIKEVRET